MYIAFVSGKWFMPSRLFAVMMHIVIHPSFGLFVEDALYLIKELESDTG